MRGQFIPVCGEAVQILLLMIAPGCLSTFLLPVGKTVALRVKRNPLRIQCEYVLGYMRNYRSAESFSPNEMW